MAVCLFAIYVYMLVHVLPSLPKRKEVIDTLNFTTSTSILSNDSFQDHVRFGSWLSRLVELVCL